MKPGIAVRFALFLMLPVTLLLFRWPRLTTRSLPAKIHGSLASSKTLPDASGHENQVVEFDSTMAQPTPSPSASRPISATDWLRPPFVRAWAVQMQDQIDNYQVVGNSIYFGTFQSYGTVDLRTGKKRWETRFSEKSFSSSVLCDGQTLYVEVGQSLLSACDAGTGRRLWSLPLRDYAYPMAIRKDTLYCWLDTGKLTSLNVRTRKRNWTVQLTKGKPGDNEDGLSCPPVVQDGRLYAATGGGDLYCIAPATGRILWSCLPKGKKRSPITGIAFFGGKVYCDTRYGPTMAIDTAAGHIDWEYPMPEGVEGAPLVEESRVLVSSRDGKLRSLARQSGRLEWEQAFSFERNATVSPPCGFGGGALVTDRSKVLAFSMNGKRLWEFDTEESLFEYPVHVLGDSLLIAGSHGFWRFRHGSPVALPTASSERLALARRLAARYDTLGDIEQRTLHKLGEEAFDALYPIFRARLATYADAVKRHDKSAEKIYSGMNDMGVSLKIVMTPRGTQRILDLLPLANQVRSDDSAVSDVFQMLAEKGDTQLTLPLFLETLHNAKRETGYLYRAYSLSLKEVSHSNDPRAIGFMLEQLANERADPEIRNAAFVNLARVGSEAGVKAVLAARDTQRLLPGLAERMRLEKLGSKPDANGERATRLLAVKRDARGILWGLLASPILGSMGDLWIAHHDGTHWVEPIFTGVDLDIEGRFHGQTRKKFAGQGLSNEKLIAGAWFAKFVHNPALTLDSDGDGLTDLVETRVGTDPRKADTDGDGIDDLHDRNPLAAARDLTDEDKVIRAAFEGRLRFTGRAYAPYVVQLPEGMRPLELNGCDTLIVLQPRGSKLADLFGTGVGLVDFLSPAYDFENHAVHERSRGKNVILWNGDHTEAKLGISVYYGGLDGTVYDVHLKRFGTEWLVVDMIMTAIS